MGKGDGSGEGWGEGEGKGTGAGWGEGEGQGTGAGMGAAEWKHGLFGCASDGGNLLCGWCCGPCLLCQNANKMGESPVLYYILSCISPCVPIFLLRQKLREQNGIEGDTTGDAIAACCCACCANIQIADELDH